VSKTISHSSTILFLPLEHKILISSQPSKGPVINFRGRAGAAGNEKLDAKILLPPLRITTPKSNTSKHYKHFRKAAAFRFRLGLGLELGLRLGVRVGVGFGLVT
jgi:hypothetical protein